MKKSSWFHKHQLEVGIAIIFSLIGFLIGVAARFKFQWDIQFDNKINLADVLSIISTVILAWVVTTVLDKEKHAENTSKDILIRRLEELYSFISDTAVRSTSDNFLYTDATSATKRINTTLTSVYNLLESINLSAEGDLRNNIEIQTVKLNDLMTSTPAQQDEQGQQPAVRVTDNKLFFNKERKLEIENAFESLKNHIISLELAVNKL